MWGATLPGHSCGGSGGLEPPSLLGPLSRTTRDVAAALRLRASRSKDRTVNRLFAVRLNRAVHPVPLWDSPLHLARLTGQPPATRSARNEQEPD